MKNTGQFQEKEKSIDICENNHNWDNSTKFNGHISNKFKSTYKRNTYKNKNGNQDKFWKNKRGNNSTKKYNIKKNYFLGNKRNYIYSIEDSNICRNESLSGLIESKIKNDEFKTYLSQNYFLENKNDSNSLIKKELPIFPFKEEILEKIEKNRIIIISGNTGCGKSTQVPQYIFYSDEKNSILMTQPRRIAAVSISKRLSEEMNLKIGNKIGFHVSMNPNFSSNTNILVATTGIFLEELIHKNLEYTHIIIDEVHERDIYIDLVLAMIKWYFEQHPRSKIKVILMSATISEEQFAEYLKDTNGGEIPIIRIEESPHKITQFSLDSVYLNIQQDPRISRQLKEEIVIGRSIFGKVFL